MNYFNHEIEMELEEIAKRINECRRMRKNGVCPCGGQPTVGKPTHQVGKRMSLAIVAEAPAVSGWWETNRAFYSYDLRSTSLKLVPAGCNLNECLRYLKTTVEQSYFVEAIKCRPDNTSKWSFFKRVRSLCLPFLEQQLKTIRPRLVLALGKVAAASCLEIAGEKIPSNPNEFKFEKVAGRWAKCPWDDCWVLPLYHTSPANNGRWPKNKEYIGKFLAEHPKWRALMS
jgi:uracil-DNA glycosylase family 4